MAFEVLTKIEMLYDDEELRQLEEAYKAAKAKLLSYLHQKEGLRLVRNQETAPDAQHRAQLKGLHEMSDEEIKNFALRFYAALRDMREEEQ